MDLLYHSTKGVIRVSIKTIQFDVLTEATAYLERVAESSPDIVYRGHQNQDWQLSSTLRRYENTMDQSFMYGTDHILNTFRGNLAKLGKLPYDTNNRLDWLEYAQHHGVLTPYLDFTRSPYVAMFFAVNGCQSNDLQNDYFVIYALNVRLLGLAWAFLNPGHPIRNLYTFLYPGEDLFSNEFPENSLQFIPYTGRSNDRMLRQMGVFLYDTLDYGQYGASDLEDFISGIKAGPNAVLEKIYINKKLVSNVLSRLELMGITATLLFGDSSGAAMDTKNSFNYQTRTMTMRDINIPYKP